MTSDRPALFCLHGLGLSATVFHSLTTALDDEIEVVALDLPGFGSEPASSGTDLDSMVALVEQRIASHGANRWLLLGHSMGGKVATLVADRVLSGAAPLFGLAGLVLVCASPPTPEPMTDEAREQMLGWAEGTAIDAAAARTFLDQNLRAPLPGQLDDQAMTVVRQSDPAAWRAWLTVGSLEDRSAGLTPSPLPALVIAGGDDGDLGEDAQRALVAPWFDRAEMHVIEQAAHLPMLERPEELAAAIRGWAASALAGPEVPAEWSRVIASDHTSARTRAILARRALVDDLEPTVLDAGQLETLRVLAERTVPQPGVAIDLAVRVDAQLATGLGDGWRDARLPADVEAYRLALSGLAGWATQSVAEQEQVLTAIADEEVSVPGLDAAALAAWLDDAVVDLTRQWLAHPATMARIGFDGFATGGDRARPQGWVEISAGAREDWEPEGIER